MWTLVPDLPSASIPKKLITNKKKLFIIYLACAVGFFGPKCDLSCGYSSYGHDCQSTCDCSNDLCHHVVGCFKSQHEGILQYFRKIQRKVTQVMLQPLTEKIGYLIFVSIKIL